MQFTKMTRVAAGVATLGLLTAACGFDSGSAASTADVGGGSLKQIDDLKGATFKVGSKDFDEQLVLGQIALLTLKASGAKVVDKTNIQGTVNTRRALKSGDIDMYWEYTGTGWITFLKHTDPVKGSDAQYDATAKEDLQKNGIKWLDPAPFNNTYALATTQQNQKRLGVKSLSDVAKLDAKEQTYCLESEFASRDDGFKPMTKVYGYDDLVSQSRIKILDTGLVYSQTAKGNVCNFGEVFTTDGRIPALDLYVLDDDKGYFPLYNPAITVQKATFEKYPGLAKAFAPVAKALTTKAIQGMNKKVSVDGLPADQVAEEWMKQQGFIG
jgi:osmoprotectant transport system substrate-binding protein